MKIKYLVSGFFLLTMGLLFAPTNIYAGDIYVIDSDGNGSEFVTLSGSSSYDTDGAIVTYQWNVNGSVVSSGFGPVVGDLQYTFLVGVSTVNLSVTDDAAVTSTLTTHLVLLPQSSNLPPIARAVVPSAIKADVNGMGIIAADASLSNDPENDPIIRYKWTEGTTTYYDGVNAVVSLSVPNIGVHTLTLTVYSQDSHNIIQSGSRDFAIAINPFSELLAGREFARTSFLHRFSFDINTSTGSYSAIAYNPLIQRYFVSENKEDRIYRITADGTLEQTIDISGLHAAGVTTDAEGITWMYGDTYALALHDGKEIAVVNIVPTTTVLVRANATIYDVSSWPGKPKGLMFSGRANSFYGVCKNTPMAVIKSQIVNGQLQTVWTKNVDNLPASDLSDITVFPRLTPNFLLISESSQTVMEADLSGATAVLKSSFSLSAWPIPQGSGIAFGADGSFRVVTKHTPGSEDDFSVFTPTASIANLAPISNPGPSQVKIDSNGDGFETATFSGSASYDPDGSLVTYQWNVNGAVVAIGSAPAVADLTRSFSVGKSTITLVVTDDALVSTSSTTYITVKPQGSNNPPIADAAVPSAVEVNGLGVASVDVDASASYDPDGDPINRYTWTEGTTTFYDGASAVTTLSVNGTGIHTIRLTVYSTDHDGITQSGYQDFAVEVDPLSELLAGRSYRRTSSLHRFSFDTNTATGSYSGAAYNPLTQTYFIAENKADQLYQIQPDGTLLQTIDISALHATGVTTDAEGVTWMYGNTYALALHDGKEIAVVNIMSTTTAISRAQATIYDISSWPGKPKGLMFSGHDNAFYGVCKNSPMAVVKSQIVNNQLQTIWTKTVDNLPVSDLSDVTVFPRLTPNFLLISESSKTIIEADLSGATAVMRSSFSLTAWPIPQGSGFAFGGDGSFRVVTKHAPGTEDDFNVFTPTGSIQNLAPVPVITHPGSGQGAWAIDRDGNGKEDVTVDASGSYDPDGSIVHYQWFVNGQLAEEGFAPRIPGFKHTFEVGSTTVKLVIFDDARISAEDTISVEVAPKTGNLPPVADANVPSSVIADATELALVNVDASLSYDPDGDAITRYIWTEGQTTYYDGAQPATALSITGLGQHQLTLTVFSTDSQNITQFGTKDFFLPSPQPAISRMRRNWPVAISLT